MKLQLQIKMNEDLFIRNPKHTELGRNIIKHSIQLIAQNGFEAFTFKKLAEDTGTTETGIYRYFENKHRLLISQQRLSYGVVRWPRTFVVPVYIISWYWGWLEYQISFRTNNVTNPTIRLKR